MTSTGNDIVSLNAIDITRSKQCRFYSKILSTTEKDLYNQPEFAVIPFENFVWILWSIKESAYKYLQRINPGLVFSPTKFEVKQILVPSGYSIPNFTAKQMEGTGFDHNDTAIKGIITFGTDTLYSRSLMYRELIVTALNAEEIFENTCWGIKLIDKPDSYFQSTEVRIFLVNRLRLFGFDNISLSKNTTGIPIILKRNKVLPIPVSLSHHDHLVAYSFQLESYH
ncbi:MAG TPA: 4'-phosphopantetheinyl transferase superfamily protein [Mucilaginibacter sp.]|jgi:phosphopantetheinyl transferase (holo-ACP synthase)